MNRVISVEHDAATIQIERELNLIWIVSNDVYEDNTVIALTDTEAIELAHALLAAAGERTIEIINMVHSADFGIDNSLAQMASDTDIQRENSAIYSEFKDTEMDGLGEGSNDHQCETPIDYDSNFEPYPRGNEESDDNGDTDQ